MQVEQVLEIIQFHEERIRISYGSFYTDYVLANGKTERKYKSECNKKCNDLIAQIKILEKIKSEIKALDKQTK